MKMSVKFMWGNLAEYSSEWLAEVHGEGWGATLVVDWKGWDGEYEGQARLATLELDQEDGRMPTLAELAQAQDEACSRDSMTSWVASMEESFHYDDR